MLLPTFRNIINLLIIFITCSSAIEISIAETKSSIQYDNIKIIGGNQVNIEDFNYLVSIKYRGSHICGGSIINERTIVTAAHCFKYPTDNPNLIEIEAGTTFINRKDYEYDNDRMIIKIENLIIHPEYNIPGYLDNDIAILILKKDLNLFSNKIGSINLPEITDYIKPGTNVEISGWGALNSYSNKLSNSLQSTQLSILDFRICNRLNYYLVNPDNMICASHPWGGKDSCSGDSGGPLIVKDSNNNPILAGIVSWGFGCGDRFHPGVYTKVSKFSNWIKINQFHN